jgi:hypothetical protein
MAAISKSNGAAVLLLRHFFSIQLKGMKGRWQIHTGNKSKKDKRKSSRIFIFFSTSRGFIDLIVEFVAAMAGDSGNQSERVYMLDRCVTSAIVAEHLAQLFR